MNDLADALVGVLFAEIAIMRVVRLTNGRPVFQFDKWERILFWLIMATQIVLRVTATEHPRLIDWMVGIGAVIAAAYSIQSLKSERSVKPPAPNPDAPSDAAP